MEILPDMQIDYINNIMLLDWPFIRQTQQDILHVIFIFSSTVVVHYMRITWTSCMTVALQNMKTRLRLAALNCSMLGYHMMKYSILAVIHAPPIISASPCWALSDFQI